MTSPQKQTSDDRKKTAQKTRRLGPVNQGPEVLLERPGRVALQRALTDPAMADPAAILAMQKTAGNRAVQRFIVQHQALEMESAAVTKTGSATSAQAAPETILQRSCGNVEQHKAPAIPGSCHEWILAKKGADDRTIWEFRARGKTEPGASLDSAWYGTHIIKDTAKEVNKESVKGLAPGTVLILEPTQAPPHSMIVVGHTTTGSTTETWVSGFNNTGTFGPDAPYMQLDHTLRSLHTPAPALRGLGMTSQWTENGKRFMLPTGVVTMYAVADATYRQNVQVERLLVPAPTGSQAHR